MKFPFDFRAYLEMSFQGANIFYERRMISCVKLLTEFVESRNIIGKLKKRVKFNHAVTFIFFLLRE